jgi:hypothetical protein
LGNQATILVGTPPAQAKRAAALKDGDADIGISVIALAECAHVLRTQYGVEQQDVIDSLIELVQRANVAVVDGRSDLLVTMLVTFDRDQRRYGVPTREP